MQQSHAIERMRIDIAFAEQLPGRVVESVKRSFEQIRAKARFQEPLPQEHHQIQIQPGVAQPMVTHKVAGWQSVRESAPGMVVEAILLNQGGFSYESADYRGWETAHRRFLTVAADVISQVASVIDFKAIGMDYTDRFVFQGKPIDAKPEGILQAELLTSISDGARTGQFLWHLHRGWFEKQDGRTILMNQNIDAQEMKSHTGADVRSLQIFTRAEFRPEPEQFDLQDLDKISNHLHTLCNSQFSGILTDDAKQMVGMRA